MPERERERDRDRVRERKKHFDVAGIKPGYSISRSIVKQTLKIPC